MRRRDLYLLVLPVSLGGCTATQKQQTSAGFVPPAGTYKLIVMRPDIAVSALTAGGLLERREDWTNTARENVLAALRSQQAKRGAVTQIALTHAEAGADEPTVVALNQLHEA